MLPGHSSVPGALGTIQKISHSAPPRHVSSDGWLRRPTRHHSESRLDGRQSGTPTGSASCDSEPKAAARHRRELQVQRTKPHRSLERRRGLRAHRSRRQAFRKLSYGLRARRLPRGLRARHTRLSSCGSGCCRDTQAWYTRVDDGDFALSSSMLSPTRSARSPARRCCALRTQARRPLWWRRDWHAPSPEEIQWQWSKAASIACTTRCSGSRTSPIGAVGGRTPPCVAPGEEKEA